MICGGSGPFFCAQNVLENLLMGISKYDQIIAVSGGKEGCTPFIEFIFRVIAET
jgi:hypothetical protein